MALPSVTNSSFTAAIGSAAVSVQLPISPPAGAPVPSASRNAPEPVSEVEEDIAVTVSPAGAPAGPPCPRSGPRGQRPCLPVRSDTRAEGPGPGSLGPRAGDAPPRAPIPGLG